MRRAAFVLALAAAAAACSTPQIHLTQRFVAGETRAYRLTADAETRVGVAGEAALDRIEITAVARVRVLEVRGSLASLRLTVETERAERDGAPSSPPPAQEADVLVGSDGAVREITAIGRLPAELSGVNVADVAPLLGLGLPRGRVHIGDRWTRRVPGDAGTLVQRGRLAALRVVDGLDAAVVALETRRPLALTRSIEGLPLELTGTEISSAEVAFAFREGFPVHISSAGRARLEVRTGPARGGVVTISTRTELALLSRSA